MTEHSFICEQPAARLDSWLAARLPHLSRARIQALVKAGHVSINSARTRASAPVRPGDLVRVIEPPMVPASIAPQPIPLVVLFEDADLLVLDKPPGLVVHPGAGNRDGTIVNALLHHCPNLSGIGGVERPGIVHRLDKETSGCLVVAKTDFAHRALVRSFAGREVEKTYLALVAGRPARPAGEVVAPIGRHPVHRQKMAVLERGRSARTSWRVIAEVHGGTLLACDLHTGRTHQIRVHLRHLGHPVLGDALYGRRGDFPRQMLHAWRLGFLHPRTGERLTFTSPIPADFREAGVPPHLP